MEPLKQWNKALDVLKKYRYGILVLLIGIGLMLLPQPKTESPQTVSESENIPKEDINQQIAKVLRKIQGVGEVEVLLTVAAGEETLYQTDQEFNQSGQKIKTVIISDAQKNQYGLISQVIPPQYLGAIVVCQGADSPAVRLAIVEAISDLTGLGADRISVLKMK